MVPSPRSTVVASLTGLSTMWTQAIPSGVGASASSLPPLQPLPRSKPLRRDLLEEMVAVVAAECVSIDESSSSSSSSSSSRAIVACRLASSCCCCCWQSRSCCRTRSLSDGSISSIRQSGCCWPIGNDLFPAIIGAHSPGRSKQLLLRLLLMLR
uniref:Putative secreted protein n=1 Tax=Anopheles darlingi TaxID=43151 RepID=A0A2M4DLU3_ANODA